MEEHVRKEIPNANLSLPACRTQLSRIASSKDRKRKVIASEGKENSKVWKGAKYIKSCEKVAVVNLSALLQLGFN